MVPGHTGAVVDLCHARVEYASCVQLIQLKAVCVAMARLAL